MKCPGQDTRYWKPGAIFEAPCERCGKGIEFFPDDTTRTCSLCGQKNVNPKVDFGCASYCPYAEQCLSELPAGLEAAREALLKDRVAVEMKQTFGKDFKRIRHAADVARYAEKILQEEKADPAVVLCAAYLHDIGIHEAQRKHHGTAARHQHEEGRPIARDILQRLGAKPELIDEVCDIVGHPHHPRKEETLNFKVVYDADLIVNLEEDQRKGQSPRDRLSRIVEKGFLTGAGKRLAQSVLSEARQ
jgi:putative nucleotidyltransferase with HDIG domain